MFLFLMEQLKRNGISYLFLLVLYQKVRNHTPYLLDNLRNQIISLVTTVQNVRRNGFSQELRISDLLENYSVNFIDFNMESQSEF